METKEKFIQKMSAGYTFKGNSVILGGAMLEGECQTGTLVRIPVKTINRHGLIAGATGTGKTKTLQLLAESLSEQGVPSLLMGIKGDPSGIARSGNPHPKIDERHEKIGVSYSARGYQVEFLTISDEKGARFRATVAEFGPVLFSKILDLNDVQLGIVSLIFKYCDDRGLPILDIKDFKRAVQHITDEGKEEIEKEYGRISTASTGAILRKVIELEQQEVELFFGEKSFEVNDLTRVDDERNGIVSILRLVDIQDRPKLFSTFMLSLLAEIYSSFPEEGDLDQSKLTIFIDEAHLIFEEASDDLLDTIETIIKLIRSKGVGFSSARNRPEIYQTLC